MIMQTPPDTPAAIEITVTPDAMLVVGEIDASNCGVLRKAIAYADQATPGPIRLDMSQVQFMDSSGIGVLIGSYKARADGVVVVHPSESVERVLLLTGLYDRFVQLG